MEPERDLRFGPFRLDAVRRRLERDGEPVELAGKPMELLVALVATRDRVVTRDELLALVWPDVVVEEANLTQTVSVLRRALGEAPGENRFVATVPGRGYRFVAPVTTAVQGAGASRMGEGVATATGAGRRWRRWATFATVAATLAVGLWLGLDSVRRPPPPPVRPGSLAVLPIQVGGFDRPADERGLALTDALIRELVTRGVDAAPTRAVVEFADPRRDTPQQAGRALGVELVVAVTVREAAGRISASGQLVRTADGVTAGSFVVEERGELAAVGERLARALAERIAAVAANIRPSG
ncbi:MAG: transcriptional regulator [Thermoanaerobaculia bacterium]|nr:transcriptional regulator [Thermoanaerobaculia bacterium]